LGGAEAETVPFPAQTMHGALLPGATFHLPVPPHQEHLTGA
jgi:hypothetical protein